MCDQRGCTEHYHSCFPQHSKVSLSSSTDCTHTSSNTAYWYFTALQTHVVPSKTGIRPKGQYLPLYLMSMKDAGEMLLKSRKEVSDFMQYPLLTKHKNPIYFLMFSQGLPDMILTSVILRHKIKANIGTRQQGEYEQRILKPFQAELDLTSFSASKSPFRKSTLREYSFSSSGAGLLLELKNNTKPRSY